MDIPEKEQPKLPDDVTVFAKTTFRGEEKLFGIKQKDRRNHVYVIGKTGMGKTTMLQNMIIGDINAGRGLCIVDPHGDVAEDILDFIPPHRVNDVIYFNPADIDFPIGFNVFEKVEHEHKYLIASGLVGVFKKMYAESWGPRLEYILRNTILALLDYPEATMLGILRLLADKKYRNEVVRNVEDPVVKSFWVDEFANYNERFASEAISPIQNKVGQFLSSAIVRNIVGQVKSSFDLRDVMDNNKILIMSLSKGKIGEDNTALLGSMMITKIQLAAMSRANIPEEERNDFYLYVDEFQNFATESFATILSEARKYRLNLTVAHQYIEQMSDEVREAVFGNVGSLVAFRVGAQDAEFLEKEFEPVFMQTDLVNIPAYNIYLKMMIDGLTSQGFSAVTIPRFDEFRTSARDKVIAVSRERYARGREEVEDKIKRWSGSSDNDNRGPRSAEDRMKQKIDRRKGGGRSDNHDNRGNRERGGRSGGSQNRRPDDREMFNAICHTCNKVVEVPFKPDPMRPVYCRECLPEAQRNRDSRNDRKNTNLNNQDRRVSQNRDRRPNRRPRDRSNQRDKVTVKASGGEPVVIPTPKTVSLKEALSPIKKAMTGKKTDKKTEKKSNKRGKRQLKEGQAVSFED